MKHFVLGLMILLVLPCYSMEHLDAACRLLGGEGYNCSDTEHVCCQYTLGIPLYFIV